jgi:peptidoglycan hydrolase-like protein with peptidoglycan-binding domain
MTGMTAFITKASVLAACLLGAAPAIAQPVTTKSVPIDRNVLHVQVILDHLGFGPGVLDGRGGQSLVAALKGFQEAKGLPRSLMPGPCRRCIRIVRRDRRRRSH